MSVRRSESKVRWYHSDTLEFVEQVERATPKELKDKDGNLTGEVLTHRDANLTDARKGVYLPGVTSVNKAIVNPWPLVDYLANESVRASIVYPYQGDGSEEDIDCRYIPMVRSKASESSSAAKDLGKQLHKDKERYFLEGIEPETVQGKNICIGYEAFMAEHGAKPENIRCEVPFGSKTIGYAGTPDDHLSDINFLIDLKTTKHKNFATIKTSKQLFLSWKLQLGGYRVIAPSARLWQGIASQETGEMKFIELADSDMWARAFNGIFDTWCAEKEYDPRRAVAA